MRSFLGLLMSLSVFGAAGCVLVNANPGGSGAGSGATSSSSSSGGAGGNGAGGATGSGGATGTGGGAADPCMGVPTQGQCIAGNQIQSCFVSEESGVPVQIITTQCNTSTEACKVVAGTASCQPVGDCYEGDTRCFGSTAQQECVGGKWQTNPCVGSTCVAQPGLGAACTQQDAAGSGFTLTGHVDYEYHKPNADFTDFDPAVLTSPAVDMFITVFDNGELIGMDLSSPGANGLNPGDWSIKISRQPSDQTFMYFWPMLFDSSGNPRMGVAHATSSMVSTQSSDKYWSYGFGPVCAGAGTCNTLDTGKQLITEAMGSGAVNIYEWVDYGIFRVAGLIPNPATPPLTMAIFWEVDNHFDCGNCFAPPQMGGANVVFDKANNLSDHYDSSMNISGTSDTPSHWATTTISHEFGHWVMQSYSKSPGEGGTHYVDAASSPGLAYSEGWATFSGQTNLSADNMNPDPIAFRKSQGTAFWVDLQKVVWSGGAIELGKANGPIDQDINENVVTALMWSLWAGGKAHDPQNLGDAPMFTVLGSQRLLGNVNRGYKTVDLVDYLDALKCEKLATGANMTAVAQPLGYPYDNVEQCQ